MAGLSGISISRYGDTTYVATRPLDSSWCDVYIRVGYPIDSTDRYILWLPVHGLFPPTRCGVQTCELVQAGIRVGYFLAIRGQLNIRLAAQTPRRSLGLRELSASRLLRD